MAQIIGAKQSISGYCLPLQVLLYVTFDSVSDQSRLHMFFSPSVPIVYDEIY